MTPVSSSAFSHVHHDGAHSLTIRFHKGAEYRYDGVTPAAFAAFMAAPSLGQHFTGLIKPHHPVTRL